MGKNKTREPNFIWEKTRKIKLAVVQKEIFTITKVYLTRIQ